MMSRTPLIFRHFRGFREGEPISDSAAWVGPSEPDTYPPPSTDPAHGGRFLVEWIDVAALRWFDHPRRGSLGRDMEAVVTARIFDGETP